MQYVLAYTSQSVRHRELHFQKLSNEHIELSTALYISHCRGSNGLMSIK